MTENTGRKQEKSRFQKGVSGNPTGKPKGARHQSTLLAERLFSEEIKNICAVVISEAKNGNIQAAKIILDRILPPKKERSIEIDLPTIETGQDLVKAIGYIISVVGSGGISPAEGEALSRMIDTQAKVLELHDFERRLAALENQRK